MSDTLFFALYAVLSARLRGLTHKHSPQAAVDTQAEKPTALIPIRVEFETETQRIRDCFVWNLNESLITPETFARIFCTDLDLPLHPWVETIAAQIRAQIEDHEGVATTYLGADAEMAEAEDESAGDEVNECRVILSVRSSDFQPRLQCTDAPG